MLGRLLERGKTSGREDDNVESIKKRFSESMLTVAECFLIPAQKPSWRRACLSSITTDR